MQVIKKAVSHSIVLGFILSTTFIAANSLPENALANYSQAIQTQQEQQNPSDGPDTGGGQSASLILGSGIKLG